MMPWKVWREIDKILERQLPRFFSRKYFLLLVTNTINHLQFIIYRSVSSKVTCYYSFLGSTTQTVGRPMDTY